MLNDNALNPIVSDYLRPQRPDLDKKREGAFVRHVD